MNHRPWKQAGASFRTKLLVAMMLVVSVSTGITLYLAQHNAEANVQHNLQLEFQSEFGHALGMQEAHLAAIADRCRVLAKSVRIRASLEENDVDDLYLNAAVELRDVLENGDEPARSAYARSLRAKFFRFLNAQGGVMQTSRAQDAAEAWESQLAMNGAPDSQQFGYIVRKNREGREVISQLIVTPIITTDTSETIGAIALGFDAGDFASAGGGGGTESGIWLNGHLYFPAIADANLASLSSEVAKAINTPETSDSHFAVNVNGSPHLLFYKNLNPRSRFPHAYQVCLYPLADSFARQRQLRWQILGAGALLLLGGLTASHFISTRLSKPVEQLAEDSAENFAQRERAEAALDLTEKKYQSIFENAVEGIFLTTPNGHYISANPALARMYGYASPEELIAALTDIGRQLYVQPGRREEFIRLMNEHGSVEEFESEIFHRDGHILWILENARQVRNEVTSELIYYEGLVQDITQRKQAADKMIALNSELQTTLVELKATQEHVIRQERLGALGQMASGIAHDFNNALVPILGFCELLLLSPKILTEKEKVIDYLETIQTAAKDAAGIVSRLREFYRAKTEADAFTSIDLKRLIEQAVTLTRPKWKDQAQSNGATVEMKLDLAAMPMIA